MLSAGQRMIDADSPLHVLALNSGSSSLKFGLYCARSSRIEILLSGEAESIGDEGSKFHAEDAGGNVLFSETGSHSQPTGSSRSYRQSSERRRDAAGRDRASHRSWRTEALELDGLPLIEPAEPGSHRVRSSPQP
jgi:hypothetical protein